MAQICRPCLSDPRTFLPGEHIRAFPVLSQRISRTQRRFPRSLEALRLRPKLSPWSVSRHAARAVLPGQVSNNHCKNEHIDQKFCVLKLITKVLPVVLPVILLRAAPALASTITLSAASSTAKGLRVPELLTSAWTGLMAGCLHTLTGPDHLAALAPLSIGRTKMEGAFVGALWGCGHDAGQILFGLLFLVLKEKLQIDLLRTWSARVVGVTLLVIGAVGIKEAQEVPIPCLAGEGCEADYEDSGGVQERKKPFGFATFGTGVVHGLQPDALLVILPALALPSRLAGVAFLFMFLLGTVVAMASYTAFVGSCSEALQKRVPWITQRLSLGSSLIAIAVGLSILAGEIFGINLF
ncbi:uncharacterized protein LOC9659115 [Selaginella moellendorffii]|nr:uncharacterized protein LOC9659115 [Selaginella moellendorffii]|eukprot:XP_002990873.2 uncharacterized protein LOC9659115 [Selaginella moellendorffii]